MKFCFCNQWVSNINILLAYIGFGIEYGFEEGIDEYEYCPWCGSKLMTVEELIDEK